MKRTRRNDEYPYNPINSHTFGQIDMGPCNLGGRVSFLNAADVLSWMWKLQDDRRRDFGIIEFPFVLTPVSKVLDVRNGNILSDFIVQFQHISAGAIVFLTSARFLIQSTLKNYSQNKRTG
jgi:hypothetical protein